MSLKFHVIRYLTIFFVSFRFVSFRFVSWNTVSPFNAIYMGNQMANYGGRYIKFEFGETFETTVATQLDTTIVRRFETDTIFPNFFLNP